MTNPLKNKTDDEILAISREIAGDDAEVDWFDGDGGHRALQVYGAWPRQAHRIAAAIERRLFGAPDRETGLHPADFGNVGMVANAGFVAVWIR